MCIYQLLVKCDAVQESSVGQVRHNKCLLAMQLFFFFFCVKLQKFFGFFFFCQIVLKMWYFLLDANAPFKCLFKTRLGRSLEPHPLFRSSSYYSVLRASAHLNENQRLNHFMNFKHLHLLPVNYNIDFKIPFLVSEALNGLVQIIYLLDMLLICPTSRFLRSPGRCLLQIPRAHSKSGDRTLNVYAAKAQNSQLARVGFSRQYRHLTSLCE